jgi:uncharacterized membrane protein
MSGLRRLPWQQGLAAMQASNAAALSPLFLAALFLPALTGLAIAVDAALDLGDDEAGLRLAGSLAYLLGTILPTITYHVPCNERLALVDPAKPDAEQLWRRYAAGWTAWNHLRTIMALAASTILTVALVRGQ